MTLESFFDEDIKEIPYELIKRRRLQVLIHSCVYYELNSIIINDETFDKWSRELEQLHKDFPEYSDKWDWCFNQWDSSSGFDLPLKHPWVYSKSQYILKIMENNHGT